MPDGDFFDKPSCGDYIGDKFRARAVRNEMDNVDRAWRDGRIDSRSRDEQLDDIITRAARKR